MRTCTRERSGWDTSSRLVTPVQEASKQVCLYTLYNIMSSARPMYNHLCCTGATRFLSTNLHQDTEDLQVTLEPHRRSATLLQGQSPRVVVPCCKPSNVTRNILKHLIIAEVHTWSSPPSALHLLLHQAFAAALRHRKESFPSRPTFSSQIPEQIVDRSRKQLRHLKVC